jgi:hypothetical protein
MMNHILEHEAEPFACLIRDSFPTSNINEEDWALCLLRPERIVETDWQHCVEEYLYLSAQLNVMKLSPERCEQIELAKDALFNTLALHSIGHVYCDAVRMKAAMTDAPAAPRQHHPYPGWC